MSEQIWDSSLPEMDFGPFNQMVGVTLDAWAPGAARVVFEVEEKHLNGLGIAHGGAAMTVLDFAMGMGASYSESGAPRRRCVTLSMNTQFIKALTPGRAVIESRKVGGGAKTFFMEAELIDAAGDVCSRAQGVFRLAKIGD
ncbi:PaaI family thioesterase [Pseudodonghicola flavimaris]|uniref:PaaI family thioesterase n=1 Tax=Pseudodonghicola flavimaris TaxID=3050036 RepID=A0ABT7F0V7_9RHOB|nr:PaaI family thioesterase [Pseudodonghicola flavimaris]MDK3018222.1 PaaI family thioesterase [Pseudodonghicola flavimaris]